MRIIIKKRAFEIPDAGYPVVPEPEAQWVDKEVITLSEKQWDAIVDLSYVKDVTGEISVEIDGEQFSLHRRSQ